MRSIMYVRGDVFRLALSAMSSSQGVPSVCVVKQILGSVQHLAFEQLRIILCCISRPACLQPSGIAVLSLQLTSSALSCTVHR